MVRFPLRVPHPIYGEIMKKVHIVVTKVRPDNGDVEVEVYSTKGQALSRAGKFPFDVQVIEAEIVKRPYERKEVS